MSGVFNHSQSTGGARLVLLVIADHAGSADGTNAWPSHSTIARKANMSVPGVKDAIKKLVAMGELHVEIQRGGTPEMSDPSRPNRYTVKTRWGSVDRGVPSIPGGGVRDIGGGVFPAEEGGCSGHTQTIQEPSINHPKTVAAKPRAPRKQDPIFEALCEECGIDWKQSNPGELGKINKAAGWLRKMDPIPTPEEIHRRSDNYRVIWEDLDFSPTALVTNWSKFGESTPETPARPNYDHIDPELLAEAWARFDGPNKYATWDAPNGCGGNYSAQTRPSDLNPAWARPE